MIYIGVLATMESQMGRTNIVLDDLLVEKAMRLTGARTKREVVDIALRRLIEKGSLYPAIRRLRGKLTWEGDVDGWRSARTTHR
jgi:Arc/MetJ family transcription regulator